MISRCLLREDSKTLLSKQNVFSQACFPSAIRHQNCLTVWQQCCEDHKFLIEVIAVCQSVCVCVWGGGGGVCTREWLYTICTGDGEYVSKSVCVAGRGGGGGGVRVKLAMKPDIIYKIWNVFSVLSWETFSTEFLSVLLMVSSSLPPPPPPPPPPFFFFFFFFFLSFFLFCLARLNGCNGWFQKKTYIYIHMLYSDFHAVTLKVALESGESKQLLECTVTAAIISEENTWHIRYFHKNCLSISSHTLKGEAQGF